MVEDLQAKAFAADTPEQRQQFFYCGKQLQEDGRVLAQHGVVAQTTVQLVSARVSVIRLIDCCQAVDQLAKEGLAVQLDIHCPPLHLAGMEDQFAISHAIKLHGPLIDDDHFFSTICSADILLIPANFDQRSIDFIRYSMPTRIPAYMASGTPILVYGPVEIGQVQYAEKAGWGLVVSACDAVALKKAIMRLSKDRDLRERLSKKALKTAISHHDAKMVQQKFKGVISNRTSGSTPNQ